MRWYEMIWNKYWSVFGLRSQNLSFVSARVCVISCVLPIADRFSDSQIPKRKKRIIEDQRIKNENHTLVTSFGRLHPACPVGRSGTYCLWCMSRWMRGRSNGMLFRGRCYCASSPPPSTFILVPSENSFKLCWCDADADELMDSGAQRWEQRRRQPL